MTDFLIGVTHVLGRNTIGQLNYSLSIADGYLTDPYKLLSVVDRATGEPAPGPGDLDLYLFESRPDSRTKHLLFALWKHSLGRDVVDLSYRYMTDDWKIDSHPSSCAIDGTSARSICNLTCATTCRAPPTSTTARCSREILCPSSRRRTTASVSPTSHHRLGMSADRWPTATG